MEQQQQTMNRAFGTLHSLGKFISGVGWMLVFLGIVAGVQGVEALDSGQMRGLLLFYWGGALGGIVGGLLVVAQGQLFSCFVAIEENTRRMADSVDRQPSREQTAEVPVE